MNDLRIGDGDRLDFDLSIAPEARAAVGDARPGPRAVVRTCGGYKGVVRFTPSLEVVTPPRGGVSFVRRVEDAKKALIEWTDRIKERRIVEQNANFQSTIDLKLSLDRISAAQSRPPDPHEVPPGRILDISA